MVINIRKKLKQDTANFGREESTLYVKEEITRVAFIELIIFEQRPRGSQGATM